MIDLEKMEKELLNEYPDEREEILNGIKVLKGWNYDEEEEKWVGKDRSLKEMEDFIQEIDDEIDTRLWDALSDFDDFWDFLEDNALEIYNDLYPDKCHYNDDTDELVCNDDEDFEKFKGEIRLEHPEQYQEILARFYNSLDDNETDELRRNVTEEIATGNYSIPRVIAKYVCNNAL